MDAVADVNSIESVDHDTLSEQFWAAARALRGHSRQSLMPWDISPSHARALSVLVRNGAMRLSDLADHLRIAPRSATEVVDVLQQRGLAERRADPDDRRATLVDLTAAGEQAWDAIHTARVAEADRFFGRLSVADQQELSRILRVLLGAG
jgi:DNA-binding MarR family transcriptional regulator